MHAADWYFDFISPYAYLALARLGEFESRLAIRCRPVLFAGLLAHWDNKGPAEIAPKRLWTYRWCTWSAERQGIPFRFPAAHPFNPLPWLRLALACDGEAHAVRRIFEALWTTGADPADPARVRALAAELGVDPVRLDAPAIKDTLRRETSEAAARGVFGVPTLAIGGELFWGVDGMDFARAFLDDPALFASPEQQRVATLPVGAARKSL